MLIKKVIKLKIDYFCPFCPISICILIILFSFSYLIDYFKGDNIRTSGGQKGTKANKGGTTFIFDKFLSPLRGAFKWLVLAFRTKRTKRTTFSIFVGACPVESGF